jgi:TolA-binding protein
LRTPDTCTITEFDDLSDNAAARRTFEELIAKYPQSEAAQKACARLGFH